MGKIYIYFISFLFLSIGNTNVSLLLKNFESKTFASKFCKNDFSKQSENTEDDSPDDDFKEQEFFLTNLPLIFLAECDFTLLSYDSEAILTPHLETPKRPPQQSGY